MRAWFYLTLRALITIAGLYGLLAFVFPAWRGAIDLYLRGERPDVVAVVVQDQGTALSVPAFAATINTANDEQTYIWFYGNILRLGETQNYTLTLLPHSNIVIDVRATDRGSTSTAKELPTKTTP